MEYTLQQREQQTRKITLWGVLVNIVLAVIKIIGGVLGQSAALLADGIHSLSDLVSDGMVLLAARHAANDVDEDHPYGHARFETITTVALGGSLLLVAVGIAWDAIARLLADEPVAVPMLFTLYIALLSILSKEALYQLTRITGERIRSRLLIANAWHHRSDAVSSIIVLIGIGGALLGYPQLDIYAAIAVAVMIARVGVEFIYESIKELVDTALDPEQVEDIRNTILSLSDVRQLHMLRSRRMGHTALVDVHIQVSPRLSVSEGHHIAEAVERILTENYEDITDVTVHIDPENDENEALCFGLPLRSELLEALRAAWAEAPELAGIDDVVLHYLDGKVAVEASLPMESVSDWQQAQTLKSDFEALSTRVEHVGQARLLFH